MMNRLKVLRDALIEEISLKSSSQEGVIDTFLMWVIYVTFFMGFYFLVYHFDEYAVKFDQWGHEVLGWRLSDVPSPAKVSWHRIAAGALAGAGVLVVSIGYVTSLYRRIKVRIAASKAKLE